MPLLALNTVLPQSMRIKYQLAIGALPIGLMFASFAPLWGLATWLEANQGVPPNSPIPEHPNGLAWIAVFLLAMVFLMLAGYALGWVLNALISRHVLGWPSDKVRAVYLRSEIPVHWLKDGVSDTKSADAESISKWEAQRKGGAVRFIAVRGVLAWGGPMLIAMYIVPALLKNQPFTLAGVVFSLVLWATGGAAFGALIWHASESNYRKLKQRSGA